MANPYPDASVNTDANAENRKSDHIELALKSKTDIDSLDHRFYYEPMMSAHPDVENILKIQFLGLQFNAPIWISSMTGGTKMASIINKNLAKACGQYGLGMGLGSCRQLLYSDEFLTDFQVRHLVGDQPLYSNLGIAQVETLLDDNQVSKIIELNKKLESDGLIVHVNPLQEWLQPEGDHIKKPPIDTIKRLLDVFDGKIIIKEVGQGMGIESLESLMSLPIEAIDFAASGGTNFALLEMLRSSQTVAQSFSKLAYVGHSPIEMVTMANQLKTTMGERAKCNQVIVSGGISGFLDGYYYIEKLHFPAIYGQASAMLEHAKISYESLSSYIDSQIRGLAISKAFLKVK